VFVDADIGVAGVASDINTAITSINGKIFLICFIIIPPSYLVTVTSPACTKYHQLLNLLTLVKQLTLILSQFCCEFHKIWSILNEKH
jgi:hypothetical protein